jgi:hypothetical protein
MRSHRPSFFNRRAGRCLLKFITDMKLRGLLSFTACATGLLLNGCGAWNVLPYSPAPNVSPLTGNWLLVGSLPSFGPTSVQGQAPFNLAVSLDVTGGEVTGYASTAFFCTDSGAGGAGRLATAPIADDGSFELQPPMQGGGVSTTTFDVRGVAPKTVGKTWSGTYTATDMNNGCTSTSGTFTAVPIMAVTGTYSATGTLNPHGSSNSAPVTITAMLRQGATGSSPSTLMGFNNENILKGNVVVQGSPCFSSGTINKMEAAVFGSFVQTEYVMNDGSTLFMSGYIRDISGGSIELLSVFVRGGRCDQYSGFFNTGLIRQS